MRRLAGCDRGVSGLQGTLVLLAIVLVAALAAKGAIGDRIAAAALDFGNFKAWGARNEVAFSESSPSITIDMPADGSSFYSDRYAAISGNASTAPGRSVSLAYYRLNGGPWTRAGLANGSWAGTPRRYPAGSYHVEAVAYDDHGDASPTASSTFETVFRPYPDAAYVDDDVPGTMTAGDPYTVHINYSNTGYLAWNDSAGYALAPGGSTMTVPAIGMAGKDVRPRQNVSFDLTMMAPAEGDYTIRYRMYCPDFGGFGDEFVRHVHVVGSSHDATVVSIDMPGEMTAGETATARITMMNTGTAAWTASGTDPVYLSMVDGISGAAYQFNGTSDRILMAPDTIIRNGNNYTFTFKLTAPAAGSYYTQYRMMWSNHYVFGQIAGHTINVKSNTPPAPKITATPTPTPHEHFLAYGKMILYRRNGEPYLGAILFYYDGPLGKRLERTSAGASSNEYPYCDWDIGGPAGHYRIYKDGCNNDFQFDMRSNINLGRLVFRQM